MGDNSIGVAMGRQAEIAVKYGGLPDTKEDALSVLDNICLPYKGRDAEFESVDPENPNRTHPSYSDYRDPNGSLGQLIAVAFGEPSRNWIHELEAGPYELDDNPAYHEWWDGPCQAFKQRYNFY